MISPSPFLSSGSPSPVLRREDADLRRCRFRVPKTLEGGFLAIRQAQVVPSLLTDLDRQGRLDQAPRELARHLGAGWSLGPNGALFTRMVADYRAKRALSRNPLRKRPVREIPALGSLEKPAKALLKARGVNLRNVESIHIRLEPNHVLALSVSMKVPKRAFGFEKAQRRVYHQSRVEAVGWGLSEQGLHLVTLDGRAKAKVQNVSREHFLHPEIRRQIIAMITKKAVAVTEALGVVAKLSPGMRDARRLFLRDLRAKQAEGAIWLSAVSPVGEEIRDTVDYGKKCGLSKATLHLAKTTTVLNCPHNCGGLVDLRLDPKTHTPLARRTTCPACGGVMDSGHVLAARATAHRLDDLRTYGPRVIHGGNRAPRRHR